MSVCYLDTETRCRAPIAFGNDLYTASAECMIVTWALDDAPVQLWEAAQGLQAPPVELHDVLNDDSVTLIAHNVAFDRRILSRALGYPIPIERWRCTMAQAYAHGLPGSIGTLGAVLGLEEGSQKLSSGVNLIQLFCVPDAQGRYKDKTTNPAEWAEFCRYAIRDTHALREIHKRLPTHNYRGTNLATWRLDQLINERGFGFDKELAIAARGLLEKAKLRHDDATAINTVGAAQAATQRAKLLAWFNSSGLALPNMQAGTVREWLERDDLRPEHRAMLELRLEAAKSAGSKYKSGLDRVGAGDRIRYAIQFSGAGKTGRSSGRGFQPHNMQRPVTTNILPDGTRKQMPVKAGYIENILIPGIKSGAALNEPLIYGGPNEACANALRGCIVAAPGNELVVGDWSNIEGRILAWCAGEEWKLEAYRATDRGEAADGYKILYSRFFGTPVDSVDDNQRQVGKVVDLSCGYLAGVGAFVAMATVYQIDLDTLPPLVLPAAKAEHLKKARRAWRRAFLEGDDFGLEPDTYMACDVLKQGYREANKNIVETGREVGKAALAAVKGPGSCYEVARCKIWSTGAWLIIELPSGRRLLYASPRIRVERKIDLETGEEQVYEYLTYMAARGKTWLRERSWAGLFIENIVQAIANDVLRAALLLVHEETQKMPTLALWLTVEGLDTAISLHVHDEVVLDVPAGSYPLPRLLDNMTTGITTRHAWMKGLPLAAAGWVGTRYKKG